MLISFQYGCFCLSLFYRFSIEALSYKSINCDYIRKDNLLVILLQIHIFALIMRDKNVFGLSQTRIKTNNNWLY